MVRPNKEEARRRNIGAGVSKMTPETIQKLEAAFAIDATIEEACLYAGISPSTYHNWINNNPDLLEKFTALRNTPILKARQTVVGSLGDANHAFKYMERKRPEEFMPKQKIEHAGKIETVDATATDAVKAVTDKYEKELRDTIAAGRKAPKV